MHLRQALVTLVVAFLAGCTATGPAYQAAPAPERDQALLYIYRPESMALGARTASFRIGGVHLGELLSGGYTRVYLKPGYYKVAQEWNAWAFDMQNMSRTLEIGIEIEPGETGYVEFNTEITTVGGMRMFRWVLRAVPPAQAKAKLSECRYTAHGVAFRAPSPSSRPEAPDKDGAGRSVSLDDLEGLMKDKK